MPQLKLSEHIERYRLCLKNLDASVTALHDLGFIPDEIHDRFERLTLSERPRIDKALRSFGPTVDASTPGDAGGPPNLDRVRAAVARRKET